MPQSVDEKLKELEEDVLQKTLNEIKLNTKFANEQIKTVRGDVKGVETKVDELREKGSFPARENSRKIDELKIEIQRQHEKIDENKLAIATHTSADHTPQASPLKRGLAIGGLTAGSGSGIAAIALWIIELLGNNPGT